MIALPTWLVVMLVVALALLFRRCLMVGRVHGFRLCLLTIVAIGEMCEKGEDRALAPHEVDVANALLEATPGLVTEYARRQAHLAADQVTRPA